MSLLCWNCRGLGNPRAVHSLIELVRRKKPTVVFLSETRLDKRRMEGVRRRLGFKNCFTVDRVGTGGGLAMLCQDEKKGGEPQPEWLLSGFREAVVDCELTEVRMIGFPYTWSRGGVEEKLDRILVSREWQASFP
ncbi:hypothetical protein SLE2022_372630 [Rubroshorea leprosula]